MYFNDHKCHWHKQAWEQMWLSPGECVCHFMEQKWSLDLLWLVSVFRRGHEEPPVTPRGVGLVEVAREPFAGTILPGSRLIFHHQSGNEESSLFLWV